MFKRVNKKRTRRNKKSYKTTRRIRTNKKHSINRKKNNLIGGGQYEEDVFRQLRRSGFDFKGKTCLDIGSRDGLNCLSLIRLGAASVVGIDLSDDRFGEHEAVRNEPRIKLIKTNLLDLDESEKFDVITCFLWNMPVPTYNQIMLKIKALLAPGGTIFIGIHDGIYKYGDNVSDGEHDDGRFIAAPMFDIGRPARQSIAIRQPSFAIRGPPPAIGQPSFAIIQPSLAIRGPPPDIGRNTGSVPELIGIHFTRVDIIGRDSPFQWIIKAMGPK